MNKLEDQKKTGELEYGRFFVEWLNKNYSFTYIAIPNEEQYSDVDIFAVSKSKEKLNLQMVTSNGETLKLASQNTHKLKKGEDFITLPVDLDAWVGKAITDKDLKHYSNSSDLIILIEGFLPTPSPKEVSQTFITNQNLPFKGVYYVSLPVISSTNLDYEKEGYVVPIKSAFGLLQ